MKKLMSNDKYELTDAIIEERKRRTAREEMKDAVKIVKKLACGVIYEDAQCNEVYHKFRYKEGEVVAVAQNYQKVINVLDWANRLIYKCTAGWKNKMFVKASLMPHQIQITDIKVQRLQDISDEDCLLEGIIKMYSNNERYSFKKNGNYYCFYNNPRTAFSGLINMVCGKGTWERNSYHVIYYFKLIK